MGRPSARRSTSSKPSAAEHGQGAGEHARLRVALAIGVDRVGLQDRCAAVPRVVHGRPEQGHGHALPALLARHPEAHHRPHECVRGLRVAPSRTDAGRADHPAELGTGRHADPSHRLSIAVGHQPRLAARGHDLAHEGLVARSALLDPAPELAAGLTPPRAPAVGERPAGSEQVHQVVPAVGRDRVNLQGARAHPDAPGSAGGVDGGSGGWAPGGSAPLRRGLSRRQRLDRRRVVVVVAAVLPVHLGLPRVVPAAAHESLDQDQDAQQDQEGREDPLGKRQRVAGQPDDLLEEQVEANEQGDADDHLPDARLAPSRPLPTRRPPMNVPSPDAPGPTRAQT